MKIIKFITSILLALVMLFGSALANTLTKPLLDEKTGKVTVSGNMSAAKNALVTIQILYPGTTEDDLSNVTNENFGSVFSNVFQVKADDKGNFTAPSYTLGEISGKYDIRIMCNKYGSSPVLFKDAFMYVSKSFSGDLMEAFSSGQAEAEAFIKTNLDAILENAEDFENLSPENREKAVSLTAAEGGFKNAKDVQNALECATVIFSMKEANNNSDAEKIFISALEKYGIREEYTPTALFENDLTSKQNQSILANVLGNSENVKIKDFMTEICDKALLTAVASVQNYANVTGILIQNEAYLKTDLSDYEAVADKSEINEKIATSGAESIKELCSALEEALSEDGGEGVKSVVTRPTHTGGGTGGGSVSAEFTKPEAETPKEPIYSFTDMQDFEWARQAVKSLFEKGIIKGVSESEFAPARNITREEFVKLLCMAFYGEEKGYDSSFNDVKKDDWFYPFVSAAVAKGLVSGISADTFGAGKSITRQDMTVLAYRFLKANNLISKTDTALSFADKDAVSDYAQEAVSEMAALGIINGIGDNNFAPKEFSNRAQAAQLIYKVLNLKAGGERNED